MHRNIFADPFVHQFFIIEASFNLGSQLIATFNALLFIFKPDNLNIRRSAIARMPKISQMREVFSIKLKLVVGLLPCYWGYIGYVCQESQVFQLWH